MATIGGGGEKVNLTAPDIAAALAPQKGRAPVMNKELADVKERMIKMGGKSVFEADVASVDDETMVNFDQMRRVIDDENKRVAAETNPQRKADMQKRYDRLARRYSVYDKLLNNEGLAAMNVEEQREMMAVMADLPGFCESIAIATNNTMTIEQARKVIMGKGGAVTPDQRKVIGEMVTQFANDDKLHTLLTKNLSKLVLDKDDATKAQEIDSLREAIKDKDEPAIKAEIAKLKTKISVHETKQPDEKERIKVKFDRLKQELTSIPEGYRPIEYTDAAFNSQISDIDARIISMAAARGAVGGARIIPPFVAIPHGPTADPYANERTAISDLENHRAKLARLQTVYRGDEANLKAYADADGASARIKVLETDLKQIDKDKASIATKEGERGNYADKYKRRMETALSDEMKRYWNTVKLTQADQAAQAEADKKGDAKAALEKGKADREKLTKAMLDKYLYLSFLKYKDGKAVGWCDDALKKFVKTDMLSRSPAQLTRDLMERINTMRYNMPPAYAKEMKAMWDEAGIGKGDPPLTLRAALDEIGKDKWEEWAAEKIPDVLGYAHARRFYFDRMKIKPAQAEFLKQAYLNIDFLTKACEAKGKYIEEADKMLGNELVTNGIIDREKLKKMLGGDWVGGTKKAMKTLAVAGALGAGAFATGFALTGGLSTTLATGSIKAGLTSSGHVLGELGGAAVKTAEAASQISGALLHEAGRVGQNVAGEVIANPNLIKP